MIQQFNLFLLLVAINSQFTSAFETQRPEMSSFGSNVSRRSLFGAFTSAAVALGITYPSHAVETARMPKTGGPVRYGDEAIMKPKEYGTSSQPVQSDLLYGASSKLADKICSHNRHFAEFSGYFKTTNLENTILTSKEPLTFYDSVTGKPLFVAPINRSAQDFIAESTKHGWPSFRDNEVVWENVRILRSGETVSVDGTHLGHNLPDRKGNRYCINLVCIAGHPTATSA